MIFKKIVTAVALFFVFVPAAAMKRQGGDIVTFEPNKRQKIESQQSESLFATMKRHDLPAFRKMVHAGADINEALDGEDALFFSTLTEIDSRNDDRRVQFFVYNHRDQAAIKKNNDAIIALYGCMRLIAEHKNFDHYSFDEQGVSPLHYLVNRRIDALYAEKLPEYAQLPDERFLLVNVLKSGANADELNANGSTPLHRIAQGDEDQQGDISLNVRAGKRDLEFMETLVEYGANPNAIDPEGKAPLHLCADNITKTSLLLALGAHYDIKDSDDNLPSDYSTNPIVQEHILKNEVVVSQRKDEIRSIVLKDLLAKTKQNNMAHLMRVRQMGPVPVKQGLKNNPCPYTKVVLECTNHISEEDIMREMGYELE